MTNIAGAQTHAKKFANQSDLSSDVREVRENIKDLGDSVGHMASRQYDRAQDAATDAIQETGDAIQSAYRSRNRLRRWFRIRPGHGRTALSRNNQ